MLATLPIDACKNELLGRINACQVLIVIGQTGSGKTTKLPQFLLEGLPGYGNIVCTQPRRLAAISVAQRVASEMGCEVGTIVGYKVRFDEAVSKSTKIKYMTDGVLLRELLADPFLRDYSHLMIDEAHERTISTDVVLSLVRGLIAKRPDLKLILASATLDWKVFQSFFDADVFFIPGREYPVTVQYCLEPQKNYLDALYKILAAQIEVADGHILVFLTGQEDIELSCEIAEEIVHAKGLGQKFIVLPLFSSLSRTSQERVFKPALPGTFKIIMATNVAETSLTIDGVTMVIDAGLEKQSSYNAKTKSNQLVTVPISRMSAKQRSGRAGRTAPGKCIRIYSEKNFEKEMPESTVPEIFRSDLSAVVLFFLALGVRSLSKLRWLQPPSPASIAFATENLLQLECIDKLGELTRKGRMLVELPFDTHHANYIFVASQMGCTYEAVALCAFFSAGTSSFFLPKYGLNSVGQDLIDPESDHRTILNIWRAFELADDKKAFCRQNSMHFNSMHNAQKVFKQSMDTCQRLGLNMSYDTKSSIVSAIAASDSHKIAVKRHDGYYLENFMQVYIHPRSVLASMKPKRLLFSELTIINSRPIISMCSELK